MNQKQNNEFLALLANLQPEEAIGLARIMCVPLIKDKQIRSGEQIIFDIVEKFPTLTRPQRRQIIKLLKEVKHDGIGTKNKEKS